MSSKFTRNFGMWFRGASLLAIAGVLSACAEGQGPAFLQNKGGDEVVSRTDANGLDTMERDIEAPDVFQATEAGLWDGRPSLGGVWVAHPEVDGPERVIIRNENNGQFVVGALFKREREAPGPRLQVSSEAAAAIGLLAGQPMNLNVVALRREEVAVGPQSLETPAAGPSTEVAAAVPTAPSVSSGALDPVVSGAAAALQTAALAPVAAAPVASTSKLDKPYIQIGFFSVETNANNTAATMRQYGMVPTVKQQVTNGKTFWRVVVGPAQTAGDQRNLMKTIKGKGFTDAYAVRN